MDMRKILFISMPLPVINDYFGNSGNAVYRISGESFFYGIESITIMSDAEVRKNLQSDREYINKNFDLVVDMEANLLGGGNCLIAQTDFVKNFKIPYYVLGIGAQTDANYSFEFLKDHGDKIKRYIDAVLKTGGTLTLRGNFTNECLKRLGYHNMFVSGCPSLYIGRENLEISDKKVEKRNFKPMFNAFLVQNLNSKLYYEFRNSVFFDQDRYFKILYAPLQASINEDVLDTTFLKLFKEGRILGSMNYFPWKQQILDGGFNFSYGTRAHGNLVAIQNKIPAFMRVIDSRTREISEFFGIPNNLEYKFNEEKDSLYDLYKSMSYKKFNCLYKKRFNAFRNFLDKHNLPHRLNENNEVFFKYIKTKKYQSYPIDYCKHIEYKKFADNLSKELNKKTKKIL